MKLSIVIPLYNEQDILPELKRRLCAVFDQLSDVDPTVIYVNDGSRDDSLAVMIEQAAQDSRFTVVDLSRNFGHQPAITAGLSLADGDAVVIMDGDLQDPPEIIPDMLACWREGAAVVRAERRSRQERGLRRLGFDMFYHLLGWLNDFPIPAQAGVFGLLDRQAVDELNRLPEKNRFLPGLRAWIGFDQRIVLYDRQERVQGAPKQTLRRLVRYALDAIFSFSYKPLRLMMSAGIFISTLGFLLACFFVGRRLLGVEQAEMGFTTLVTLSLFLGGVQLIAVGLLGEYLGRIYDEVKQRPLFIVRKHYRGTEAASEPTLPRVRSRAAASAPRDE